MGLSIVGGILAFQIFSASVKNQLTTELKEAVRPIEGTISQQVINNLQQRKVISESEMISIPTPNPSPTLIVAIITPAVASQSATPSGELTLPTQ